MKKKKPVVVTADEAGIVITQSRKNPEWGFVRLEQIKEVYENGFYRARPVSALIHGKIAELKEGGFEKDEILNGNILVTESLTPFNEDNPDRDIKISGKNGIPCTFDGHYIYSKTEFTQKMNQVDTFIQHDNGEAIKRHNESMAELNTAEESSDFPS